VASRPKLLVTGAAGFLGHGVVRAAAADGREVTAVIRACESAADLGTVATVVLDWRDEGALRRLLADALPDAVVHCAGASGRAISEVARGELDEANVGLTSRLLDAVASECPRARVVVLSSAAVYGSRPPIPTGEDAPPAPETEYAASKMRTEEVARSYSVGGGRVVVARPFNIVGAGEPPGSVTATLAAQALRAPRAGRVRVRLREASSVRDFLDVDDCARALLRLSVSGVSGRAYNVCSGRAVSISDLVALAGRVWDRRIELDLATPPAEGTVSIGDPAALLGLGWRAQCTLEESLAAIEAQTPGAGP
jgi:nucleoside-diphosphate-sugar epimerase